MPNTRYKALKLKARDRNTIDEIMGYIKKLGQAKRREAPHDHWVEI